MTQYASLGSGAGKGRGRADESNKSSRPSLRPFSTPVPSTLSEPLNTSSSKGQESCSVDPFYVFRDDLNLKLEKVDESLAEFLRVVHETDTSVNTHELKEAKKQMKRHIKNAESVLEDIRATVQLVEKDRDKFCRIDSGELYERKALVNTSQERLYIAKQEVNSKMVEGKMLADERSKHLRRAGGTGAKTEIQLENTKHIAKSQDRASLLMQQQDETLDILDVAVTRVGHLAENINEEIGAQNKILGDMDEDLVDAEEQLGVVMGKLAKLMKTKNKCQLGTILCLFAIVVILFLLVVYT